MQEAEVEEDKAVHLRQEDKAVELTEVQITEQMDLVVEVVDKT
jgi:hypothetical protein